MRELVIQLVMNDCLRVCVCVVCVSASCVCVRGMVADIALILHNSMIMNIITTIVNIITSND